MASKPKSPQVVILKNVRLSFPHIFEPQTQTNDDGTERQSFNLALMVPKDHDQIREIKGAFKSASVAAQTKAWGADEKNWPKIPSHRKCFKDGDNEDHSQREEYEGHFFINASSPLNRPPTVLTNRRDTKKKWIRAEPGQAGAPYAGCFVNAIIEVWAQKADPKKNTVNRINASLQTVQFREDGEPFGAQNEDPDDLLDEDDVSSEGEINLEDDDDDLL